MKRSIPGPAMIFLFLSAAGQAKAGIVLSANIAGSQASTVTGTGVLTESFNSFSTGNYTTLSTAVGTISSPSPGFAIVSANNFGGANSSRYFAVGSESGGSTATLTFSAPQAYFGFWWSAGDSGNSLQLYSNSTLLASLNTATALGSLGSAYDGNPNNGGDASEPFAYLNFTGTSGTTITSVVFTQTTSAGFEADNFTIDPNVITPPGTIISGGVTNTPEPSSLALLTLGAIGMTGGCWRRKKAAAADQFGALNHQA